MIVNLFRHNQWFSILLLLIAVMFFWSLLSFIPFHSSRLEEFAPFGLIIKLFIKPIFIQRLLLGAFVFGQCVYVNKLVVNQKIISVNSLFPGVFYFLLLTCFTQSIQWSPVLISLSFTLFSVKKILTLYLNKEAYSTIFDAAVMIGISTIIHPPFIIFAPIILIGMSIFSQIEWRHWILSLIGFMTPWVIFYTLVSSNIFANLNLDYIFRSFQSSKISTSFGSTSIDYGDYITLGFLLIITFFAMSELIISLKHKNIKARKSYILLLWFLLLGIIFMQISYCPIFLNYGCLAFPLSAIISNYFYYNKNYIWLNSILFIFIALIFLNHFMI